VIKDSSLHLNARKNAVSGHKISTSMEGGEPTISVEIEAMSRSLILDTGSSILQTFVSRSDVEVTAVKTFGVTRDALDIRGLHSVSFRLNGSELTHSFLLCPLPTKAPGLLGTDYLDRLGAIVHFGCVELSLTGIDKTLRVCSIPAKWHAALTVFPEGKEGRYPQPMKQEARRMDEQLQADPCCEATFTQEKVWYVKAVENITEPPRCQQIIVGRLDSDVEQNPLL